MNDVANKKALWLLPSWEERSLLGFIRDISKYDVDVVYILTYRQSKYQAVVNEIIQSIEKLCDERKIQIEKVEISFDIVETWNSIKSATDNSIYKFVSIDITTMPRNIIWTILFFLKNKKITVNYFYHSPATYCDDWISKEPDRPELLLKHSGVIEFGKPTALMIITGFDSDRTRQLIQFYDPKHVFLGIQTGNQFDSNLRNNALIHEEACKGQVDFTIFDVDSYNNDYGYESIKKVIQANTNYNFIATSVGPKLSAISLYQYYLANDKIALSYIPCNEYNKDYCKGIGDSYYGEL